MSLAATAPATVPAVLSDYGIGTSWRLGLLILALGGILFVSVRRRAAIAMTLGLTVVAVAMLAPTDPRLTAAAFAFGVTLRDPATWLALAALSLPILALASRVDWDATPGIARWLPRALYVTAMSVLLVWWYWGGPRESIRALQYLPDLERHATGLVPVVLLIGVAMQLILSMLVPPPCWRRALHLDLLATLAILLVPLAAVATAFRSRPQLETSGGVSWVAGALGLMVALRILVAADLIRDVAEHPLMTARRMALAVFTIGFSLALSVASWRAIVLPPGGDEPQYLAATMTLWRYGNLDLPAGVFSPEMNRLMASSPYQRDVHLYDDNTRDRLTLSVPLTQSTSLFVPVAGGAGLPATLELLNNDIETAGTKVVFRDPAGQVVSTYNVVIEPNKPMLLRSPSSTAPLTAKITAGKPISVAVRLADPRAGDEQYGASRAVPKRCVPVALGAAASRSTLVVQNVLSSPAKAVVRQIDALGTTRTEQPLTIPSNGSVAAPLDASGELGAACVIADGPVASVVLTRQDRALRVQQADSPVNGPVAIPMPEVVQGHSGFSEILLYNPGVESVTADFYKDKNGGTPSNGVNVPPGGTARFMGEQASRDITHATGWLVLRGPLVANIVTRVGTHTASAAPHTAPSTTLRLPVLGPQSRHYTDAQLELSNFGDTPTPATAKLLSVQGTTVWQDKIWICAHCVETRRVWYQNPVDGVLTIESQFPVNATFLAREVVVAWVYHSVGLSLLTLPGYAIAGWYGVLFSLAIVSGLVGAALFGLLRDARVTPRTAASVSLLTIASSPLLTYSAQLYPELAATLLLLVAVRLLLRQQWRSTAFGLLALLLVPVVHTRLAPLAVVALLVSLAPRFMRQGGGIRGLSWTRLITWLVPLIACLVAIVAFAWRVEPRTRPDALARYFGFDTVGLHVIGLLFDRASGLLPAFPILAIAGAGFFFLRRGRTDAGLAATVLALAPLVLVALRREGWETTPPARYLIPAIPFLAVGVAAVWDHITAVWLRVMGVVAVAWGLLATFLLVWLPNGIFLSVNPLHWYADDLFRELFGFNPLNVFPSIPANLVNGLPVAAIVTTTAILIGCTILPLVAAALSQRGDPAERAARTGTTASSS